MTIAIREDDLRGEAIARLLQRHLDFAHEHTPPESIHALDIERLRVPEITFWSAWEGDGLLGCIALRALSADHGEIKSMHTVAEARGRGIGRRLLTHLITVAQERGYRRLSLETGTTLGFAAARALYSGFGFAPCPPFGSYRIDPVSVCMTREIG